MLSQTLNNHSFIYNTVEFSKNSFEIFAGLCAVDNKENVKLTFEKISTLGLKCTRMGAFKPRTSPDSFQGLGEECLPYVFELAGKYNIKVIAMEVTHESQIELIDKYLGLTGNATGVMLQVGTRNAQNFELLKVLGSQTTYPILYKRGFGISLEESLNAAGYILKSGNKNVVFCCRGVKSIHAAPHRNLVDFGQVPYIKTKTSMPVCIDPSHSVGNKNLASDNILEINHACAMGVISGANMILLDIHKEPSKAIVDKEQALDFFELEKLLIDIKIVRNAYLERLKLHNLANTTQNLYNDINQPEINEELASLV